MPVGKTLERERERERGGGGRKRERERGMGGGTEQKEIPLDRALLYRRYRSQVSVELIGFP